MSVSRKGAIFSSSSWANKKVRTTWAAKFIGLWLEMAGLDFAKGVLNVCDLLLESASLGLLAPSFRGDQRDMFEMNLLSWVLPFGGHLHHGMAQLGLLTFGQLSSLEPANDNSVRFYGDLIRTRSHYNFPALETELNRKIGSFQQRYCGIQHVFSRTPVDGFKGMLLGTKSLPIAGELRSQSSFPLFVECGGTQPGQSVVQGRLKLQKGGR